MPSKTVFTGNTSFNGGKAGISVGPNSTTEFEIGGNTSFNGVERAIEVRDGAAFPMHFRQSQELLDVLRAMQQAKPATLHEAEAVAERAGAEKALSPGSSVRVFGSWCLKNGAEIVTLIAELEKLFK